MGVPKFYRWISERYPCLSEVLKEHQIPEFDNLYLDMNGIIHPCSHPDDANAHFRITEQQIFENIFHYIEVLFRMIKPKKVFFMAVDGVAPRAKMNQQRGRRFRSAKEAEDTMKKALEKGEILPKEDRFDSNCITPGTEFMCKLHEQLKYFVVRKISTDKMWHGLKIYLSGHEVPGEGEHKIMDYIRSEKSKADYDTNTRHCLYGLDADLIMLGLVTHDPHFALLREEVKFGGTNSQKRMTTVEETTFHLLHLSLMREYLDFEFSSLKTQIKFEYNMENIIDDWVLMGFLVGNDFIPHLPHMHIHHDALPIIWKVYKETLPKLDGFLNEGGHLNLSRFETFVDNLAQLDLDKFDEQYADLKWFESKTGQKYSNAKTKGKWKKPERDIAAYNAFASLENAAELERESTSNSEPLKDTEAVNDVVDEVESAYQDTMDMEQNSFMQEFRNHKNGYYKEKLDLNKVTQTILEEQAKAYVTAIQWILNYYYNGCQSWGWYYPFHYAPYISDVKNISKMKIEFDLGKPFLPYEQLMSVLPPASKTLVPEPLQKLMIMDNSPIIEYYPLKFESDLNGKQQDWEAVVLIPFIDQEKLLGAVQPIYEKLSAADVMRNKHGDCLLYNFLTKPSGTPYSSSLPGVFPDVVQNYANCTVIPKDQFYINAQKMVRTYVVGTRDIYYPGFPNFKNISHRAELRKEGVKVFQMNSRGENMILQIMPDKDEDDISKLAKEYIGQSILVGWPHLFEAQVVSVATNETRYTQQDVVSSKESDQTQIVSQELSNAEESMWHRTVDEITEWNKGRRGVDIGVTFVLIYAKAIMGRKYVCKKGGGISLEKQWARNADPFVLQSTVKDLKLHNSLITQYDTLSELYLVDTDVFMLGSPHYGANGKVLNVNNENGRVRVNFRVLQEPNLVLISRSREELSSKYVPGYVAAQQLGISSHFMSRITGSMYVTNGVREGQNNQNKVNVALNLKFNKRNEEVPGYTKKTEDGNWLYSEKTIDTLGPYMRKFPDLFEHMATNVKDELFYANEIFPDNSTTKLQDVRQYVKSLSCSQTQPMAQGSQFLDEMLIKEILNELETTRKVNLQTKKHIKMQVRPHLLFRPLDQQGHLIPDPYASYELFDRVVNVREGYSVPLSLRGTVVGISKGEKNTDTLYEVIFDEEFISGLKLRCSKCCGYRLPAQAMINLSHGQRVDAKQKPTSNKVLTVVQPQGVAGMPTKVNYSQNTGPGPTGIRTPRTAQSAAPQHTYQSAPKNSSSYDINQSNKPQFCTPVMTSTGALKSSQQQALLATQANSNSIQSKPGTNQEFSDIWKTLQSVQINDMSQSEPPAKAQTLSPLLEAAQTLSPLLEAAQALPVVAANTGTTNTSTKVQNQKEGAVNKTEDEFSKFMSSLSMGEKETTPEPALVPEPAPTPVPAAPERVTVDSTVQQTEELKELLNVGNATSTDSATENCVNNEKSETKQSVPPKNPGMTFGQSESEQPPKSNPVADLVHFCQQFGLPPPKFETKAIPGVPSKIFISHVKFPDGQRFQGLQRGSGEAANQSAAGMALLQLQRQFGGMVSNAARNDQYLYRPSNPNRGYNPGFKRQMVHQRSPHGNLAFGSPIRPLISGMPMAQYESQGQLLQHQKQQQQTPTLNYRADDSNQTAQKQIIAADPSCKASPTTAKNLFIPLQVIKKHTTPKKEVNTSDSRSDGVTEPPQTTEAITANHLQSDVTGTDGVTSTPPETISQKLVLKAEEKSPTKNKRSAKVKKSRSRLGANFNNPVI